MAELIEQTTAVTVSSNTIDRFLRVSKELLEEYFKEHPLDILVADFSETYEEEGDDEEYDNTEDCDEEDCLGEGMCEIECCPCNCHGIVYGEDDDYEDDEFEDDEDEEDEAHDDANCPICNAY